MWTVFYGKSRVACYWNHTADDNIKYKLQSSKGSTASKEKVQIQDKTRFETSNPTWNWVKMWSITMQKRAGSTGKTSYQQATG